MIAAETEGLLWIAREVGLPVLRETKEGTTDMNPIAQDFLCGNSPLTWVDAVETIFCFDSYRRPIDDVLREVETNGHVSAKLESGWHIFISRDAQGRRFAVGAPPTLGRAGSMQRRVAAGDLAAAVSHEVSNALGAIVGWAQLARGQRNPEEALELIESSARAARATARQLLDVAQPKESAPAKTVDAANVVSDVIRLLRPEAIRRGVQITSIAPLGQWVSASSSQLFTILWNLAYNAVEAVEGRAGHLNISCLSSEDFVVIVVMDDGPGMDETQRRRAFEPYFTTKESGTGLGLSLVKRTVEQLGGQVTLESKPGLGSRFVVQLPAVNAPLERDESSLHARPPTQSGIVMRPDLRGARLLIIEDDQAVREMMCTTLELCGARVVACSSATKARAIQETFDLVITDFTLPDGRGDQIVAELLGQGTAYDAILVSGVPDLMAVHPVAQQCAWVRKPFEPSDLVSAIWERLARAAQKSSARS